MLPVSTHAHPEPIDNKAKRSKFDTFGRRALWFTAFSFIFGPFLIVGLLEIGENRLEEAQGLASEKSGNYSDVQASTYGRDWPFAFQTARVRCQQRNFGGVSRPVITLLGGDRWYALNGVARSLGEFADHRALLHSDPTSGGFTKGPSTIAKLISLGVSICDG